MSTASGARARLAAFTRRELLARVGCVLVFVVLPGLMMVPLVRAHGFGWDFRAFYLAGRDYLAGRSPYPAHSLAALANKQEFVYPAPMAAVFAPLSLVPYQIAVVVWFSGSVAAIAVSLRVLRVRDWRCLGALFLTHPVQQAVRLGTLMPFLLLLLALLWRYRDRLWTASVLVTVLAVSKILLFPLVFWLAVTRRMKTAAVGAGLVAAVCVLGWLPIHFSSIAAYPGLLHSLAGYEETFSYSFTSLLVGLGVSASQGTALALAVAASLLLASARSRGNDFLAFRLALAASFVASPIVWGHYYVLLVVPLAVSRPRLSVLWLAAAWIKSDTLDMRHATVWVAIALAVLFAQLDLAPHVTHWWNRQGRPQLRQLVASAALAGLLTATAAAAEPGQTGTAALRSTSGAATASGVASVRLDLGTRQLCWRLWTHGFPSRPAAVTIRTDAVGNKPLITHTVIGSDGQSNGCATLPPFPPRNVRAGQRLRLRLTVRDGASVAGTLKLLSPPPASRPHTQHPRAYTDPHSSATYGRPFSNLPRFPRTCVRTVVVSGRSRVPSAYCPARNETGAAALVLHGCGGFSTFDHRLATDLPRVGIATLDVDYFSPTPPPNDRGYCLHGGNPLAVWPTWLRLVTDAARALKTMPGVRTVGVVGWSLGGDIAVAAGMSSGPHPFNTVIGFSADLIAPRVATKRPPTLLLFGGMSDKELVRTIRRADPRVGIYVYPNGSHTWAGAQGTAGIGQAAAFLLAHNR